jgi:GNAT superfamily N-acetyltransferase
VPARTVVWAHLIAAASEPEQIVIGKDANCVRGYAHFGRSRDLAATEITGELYSLYVASDSWRCGFGRQLLAASMRRLGDSGFNAVTLWVLAANGPARRFYERCGWDMDGSAKGLDDNVIEIRYGCQLSTSTC